MMIAPSSNPLNLESLITAKQDKPVAWVKASNLSAETVCNIAMKQSCVKRKLLGTRNEQIKHRFMERKTEKDQLILKRRQMRAERKKKLEEKLTKAKTMLIRDEKRIKKINKSQLSEQAQLWRAISSVNVVQNIEMLKNFTKINHDEKVALLQKLIKKNVSLDLSNSDNWNSSDDDDLEMGRPLSSFLSKSIENTESDWSTSDEETLDMSRPLKKAKF
jgi:hypothetical protein